MTTNLTGGKLVFNPTMFLNRNLNFSDVLDKEACRLNLGLSAGLNTLNFGFGLTAAGAYPATGGTVAVDTTKVVSYQARLRSNPIRLLHSRTASCLHRAPQGASRGPSLLAPRPHRRFAPAHRRANRSSALCDHLLRLHHPPLRHSAPTTPSGCPLRAREWAVACCWRRAPAAPCCPCTVSAPQVELTRAAPVPLLRRAG
jgi:hypothetical protein